MKDLKTYIIESNYSSKDLAPENVQKFLGLKYADGHGGGDVEEKISFTGAKGTAAYMERGKIEGQDKVFAMQAMYTNPITDKDATIWVCRASRPMSKTLTIVAIYTTDKERAEREVKERGKSWKEKVEQIVLCRDTDDVVTNIRNDYGKVVSYRGIGHGEEKSGIIYSLLLK